jgi:signal transduction histidine kinase
LCDVDDGGTKAMGAHIRHTVAKWFPGMSLSARLSLFVALIVIGVVASVTYLETRSFERDIDRDLMDAARLGAQSAADNLAAREQPLDPLDIRDVLHDLAEADPVIDVLSVIETDNGGHLSVFTSTTTEERAEALDAAGRAIATGEPKTDRSSTVAIFAVPVPRHAQYGVVVSVGLESLLRARERGLRIALGFALPTIVLVTFLAHLTVRQLVGQPLASILRTMDETADGDLSTRTTIARRDELGAIATRLNGMLDQLERFNRSLHERIGEATRDLSLRNTQLAASQNQLLAVRESLARAERVAALGQVAANVAHQAGTPLNLVSGYVQMIRDDPRTDERVRSRLQTIDTQIQHVTRVLRTMLDYARQPAGFEIVSLAEIIERVGDIAEPRLSRDGIRPRISIASGLPPIRADVTQLEMALLNLVTNALDAMPHGGSLAISASPGPTGIHLEIADTGTGIPAQIIERLFEPWVTSKPAGHGTGLGLAIVRDVVRAHGGSISAHNTSTGAVFVIDLPAANSPRTLRGDSAEA